jgi:RNA-binding protein YhbY
VKVDEIITSEILNEIEVPMDEQELAKFKRFKSKSINRREIYLGNSVVGSTALFS